MFNMNSSQKTLEISINTMNQLASLISIQCGYRMGEQHDAYEIAMAKQHAHMHICTNLSEKKSFDFR